MQPFTVIPVAAARARLLETWAGGPVGSEFVALPAALDRVLAEPAGALDDVPGFDRSTVDGYAVRAADTFGASEALPAMLSAGSPVLMGEAAGAPLRPGEARAVPTGGMLPPGADAVVMIEYCEAPDDRLVLVNRPVAPGENIIRRGDDARAGDQVLAAGRRLRPGDIGLLAGVGLAGVAVRRRPRIAVISTGDEIVAPEVRPGPGQVRDINSYALVAAVDAAGGEGVLIGVIRDEATAVRAALDRALATADAVVISGGSSVGQRDVTPDVINSFGRPGVIVHGVALRPGKPTILAVVHDKPVFGLPGHPVSALVTFDLFVRPVIDRLLGRSEERTATVRARIARNVASAAGREDYLRVSLEQRADGLWAVPLLGKSGLISTMARADGLVRIDIGRDGLVAGDEVEVLPL